MHGFPTSLFLFTRIVRLQLTLVVWPNKARIHYKLNEIIYYYYQNYLFFLQIIKIILKISESLQIINQYHLYLYIYLYLYNNIKLKRLTFCGPFLIASRGYISYCQVYIYNNIKPKCLTFCGPFLIAPRGYISYCQVYI